MPVRKRIQAELGWTEEGAPEWANKWMALAALMMLYAFVGTALRVQLV